MQLIETRRVKHRRRRWVRVVVFVGIASLVTTLWQGWDTGVLFYQQWKQRRALQQAKAFIAKRDAPNAQLALEVALRAVPGNPDTIRVAADMLEQVGAPQAMRLRRAVTQIESDSAEDAAKLVICCVKFRDFNAAKDALSATPPKVASQPPMLRAALAFAIATDNPPVADLLFSRLREQSPHDATLQPAQAILRLRHPNEQRRLAARQELEDLARREPALALQINREFANDALQRRDYAEVKLRQTLILADPGATFTDRLQKANVDLLIDRQPFEAVVAQLTPLAGQTEADATQFAQWLLVQNRSARAEQWIRQLPLPFQTYPGLKSALADAAALQGQWDHLARLLAEGAWGPISADTLRLAMAAHTVDHPSHPSLRREIWDMTLESAGSNPAALYILHRLASHWKFEDESERTLWTIARTFPDQTWAHQSLFNLYREKRDAKSMRDVLALLRASDGSVARYQHDWALLALLLEPTATWNAAKDTMRQLYENEPTNPTYGTGYAFALAQTGKGAEALAVVEKMDQADRTFPARQPYLAYIYGVARKGVELERATALAQGVNLLAEESYLFTRGREELNRKPEKIVPPGGGAAASPASARPKT